MSSMSTLPASLIQDAERHETAPEPATQVSSGLGFSLGASEVKRPRPAWTPEQPGLQQPALSIVFKQILCMVPLSPKTFGFFSCRKNLARFGAAPQASLSGTC